MLEAVERWLARVFPGLGLAETLHATAAMALMCTYWVYSRSDMAPRGFLRAAAQLTGTESPRFPVYLWSHLLALVLLFVVPLVLARMDRMGPVALGLGVGGARREFVLVAVMYALFVPVVLAVSQTPSFQAAYPRLHAARSSVTIFAWFHLAYLIKWTAWEFFFRGYLLFVFERTLGSRAVLISTIPFALMHYGKPPLEMYASIGAGFLLCWLALRGRSIWPGVLLHWAVATTMELFATDWFWTPLAP